MATQREEVAGGQSSDSGQYFNSYSDLGVHQLMLKDRPRTMAYRYRFHITLIVKAKLFVGSSCLVSLS